MIAAFALAATLAPAALAADAPKPKAAKAAPALSRTAGKITKAVAAAGSGRGQITVLDDAGHLEDFLVDARTRITCDGLKSSWKKSSAPGVCDRAAKILYDPATKRAAVLELKSAMKADADDAKTRPNVSGEIAVTDVIAGNISVRLGGGSTVDFKVGDATKILSEAEGKAPAEVPFESLKVGDRVEVHSKDWKTADEIHVRPAAR
ncbi:MAG: hypothetical protein ACHQ51_13645 [Elusimicrobiota bacterium]